MRCVGLMTLAALGCLATSPEQIAEDALGDTDHCVTERDGERECGSPLHRPGQPCLVCHSREHNPGEEIFAVAGTVYRRASDTTGLGGVDVTVIDALGQEVTVRTNSAGNFYVRDGRSNFDEGPERGEGRIGSRLEFPLVVELTYEDTTQMMRSVIWREGSCAACHGNDEGTDSTGRIFVEEG